MNKEITDLPICSGDHQHKDIEQLKQFLPDEDTCIDAATIFSQLSDTTRLRILYLLCHQSVCVCDIAETISMSAPAVSHHLRSLKLLGLLDYRRVGKEVYYTLSASEDGRLVHKMIDVMFERSLTNNGK